MEWKLLFSVIENPGERGKLMKTLHAARIDPRLRHVEADLVAEVNRLFGDFPGLAAFSLQDRAGLPDDIKASQEEDSLFITQIDFSAPVSDREYGEVYGVISAAIDDLVTEQPQAFELLRRGRTFARTLH
jgi:hypothetical protein